MHFVKFIGELIQNLSVQAPCSYTVARGRPEKVSPEWDPNLCDANKVLTNPATRPNGSWLLCGAMINKVIISLNSKLKYDIVEFLII